MTDKGKIHQALGVAFRYSQIDGDHHKAWVIDQIVRILAGDEYESFIKGYRNGEDGTETFEWNVGQAP